MPSKDCSSRRSTSTPRTFLPTLQIHSPRERHGPVCLGSTLDSEYAELLRLVAPVTTLALFDGTMTDATALKVRVHGALARSPHRARG
jgi:hypothetical protein